MKTQISRQLAALALCLAAPFAARAGTPPVVTNVVVTAVSGSGANTIVTVSYDISDANFTNVNVFMLVSQDSGATWTVPATQFGAVYNDYGTNVGVTTNPTTKSFVWFAGIDWDGNYTANCRVRVLANNVGLVLIPPGSYLRGNGLAANDGVNPDGSPGTLSYDGDITDAPTNSVYVSTFYIDSTLVTGGKWNLVVGGYASSHGYAFDNVGSFTASSHPVQTINWLDAVKWCNARSEMEGITPVYYTDGGYGTVLKTGAAASTTPYWKPGANGYRLPTEAEWEKAARGGAAGHRFPWSNVDTINWSQANYTVVKYLVSSFADCLNVVPFDLQACNCGCNTPFCYCSFGSDSAVGSFAPNGYNLYDMAGNVDQWCWDWYSPSYYASGQTDPQGPSTAQSNRVLRGGSWLDNADNARCANRNNNTPANTNNNIGFRCVRGVP
ncbi:conserved exported hypothetical protein [Verrucomicrobia bacterium]|nr:conserved exported hypothetical protein [Verrucomicrobiota bacterium]